MRNFIFFPKIQTCFHLFEKPHFLSFWYNLILDHHNFLLEIIKFYLEQWQLFGFLAEISNLWKLFETNWVGLNVKCHQTKHAYQKLTNFYNYFIYPNRDHTCKTNAVLLTSVKKCQQYCIGKCRCYDLYTTPICNVFCPAIFLHFWMVWWLI